MKKWEEGVLIIENIMTEVSVGKDIFAEIQKNLWVLTVNSFQFDGKLF